MTIVTKKIDMDNIIAKLYFENKESEYYYSISD